MSRVPRIRFKGFEEDWEQRKLGEVTTSYSGGTPNVGNHDYYGDEIPFIRSGEINNCHTDLFITEKGLVNSSAAMVKEGDILYALYGATSGEVSRSKLKGAINQAILAILPKAKYDSEYIAQWLKTKKRYIVDTYLQGGQGNLSGNIVKNFIVDFSSYNEQLSIGNFASSLDHLITLHQRKLEKLKIIKKSMLENLFPQNGEKTPKIRFSGFTEDWEQRKLGEMYTQLVERNIELLPFKKILSVSTMTYKGDGNGAAEESLSSYKRLRVGDIAFEGHTSKDFRYGRFVLNDTGDGIMSPRFSALRPISGMPIKFWKYYIHYEPIMKKILVNSTKSGTMMNELVVEEFLKEILLVPEEHEQQKIGRFFNGIYHLITLHQSKLEKLQKIKKSMLESMFV